MKTKLDLRATYGAMALAWAAFACSPAQASVLLVNWGGEYVTSPQGFSGTYTSITGLDIDSDGALDDMRFGYPYNATNPALFNPSSGYSGTSDRFYGGFSVNALNSSAAELQPNAGSVLSAGQDYMRMQTQQTQNTSHNFAWFMYWDKSDFLNGWDSATVGLIDAGTMSVNIRGTSNFQAETDLHFVIRQGTQFYVSEAYWSNATAPESGYQGPLPLNGGTITFNPLSLGSLGWKLYNPNGLDLQMQHGGYVFPTFDDITAVGFYFDTRAFTQQNSKIEVNSFSVLPVPETSSALLALGGLGVALLTRRRK